MLAVVTAVVFAPSLFTGVSAQTDALLVSDRSDRSNPQALAGSVVGGDVYVFVSSGAAAVRVRFWLDDPTMSASPRKDERNAPWDFAGTAKDRSALPFDTGRLEDGDHVITALIDMSDSSSVILQGMFSVNNAQSALTATPGSLDLVTDVDGPVVERPLHIDSGGTPTDVTITSDEAWLTVGHATGSTPLDTVIHVDPAGMAPGGYTGQLTVEGGGLPSLSIVVSLTVGSPSASDAIQVSYSSSRSPASALDGSTVKGTIYVFVAQEAGLDTVRFWLDDPSESGTPTRTENSAPYDLAGGTVDTAAPLRTDGIADGQHSVTARLEFDDGTRRSTTATFVVANEGPALAFAPTHEVAAVSEERAAFELRPELTTTGGSTTATLTADVGWLTAPSCCVSVPGPVVVMVDPASLPDGRHAGTVTATADGYGSATFRVELLVAGEAPTQVHLALVEDPRSSITVVWHTESAVPSELEYRPAGEIQWTGALGAPRSSTGSGTLHEVTLRGLAAGTRYEYRVRGDGAAKSPVHDFRTAPAGPASFDVVYLADTGIAGRLDGLTTGTGDVIQAVAEMSPQVVLPGGDYAYFDSDKRFATLDDAIDAWFRQVEPFAAGAPMMPTYGNHEVLLKEGYLPWAARFPTPEGYDDRRFYSFDVGPVHFISIFAVYGQRALTSSQLRWVKNDLAAARSAGRPWIVPYMHVSAFADGANHPSNLDLREQLGPVFEQYDVDLVLMSHDQSYERTWPLVDVPAGNRPTSTLRSCVSKADGVTWAKISPAGKLSNKNGGFSMWTTVPPPPWTAVRSNTEHHFGRLNVDAEGDMRLDVIGLPGGGGPTFLVDSVRFATGAC